MVELEIRPEGGSRTASEQLQLAHRRLEKEQDSIVRGDAQLQREMQEAIQFEGQRRRRALQDVERRAQRDEKIAGILEKRKQDRRRHRAENEGMTPAQQRREELRTQRRVRWQERGQQEQEEREAAARKIQDGFKRRHRRVYGSKRRVVVLGATGQIGGAVCRHCLQKGFEVIGMTRTPASERAQVLSRAGVRMYEGDMDDEHSVDRVLAFAVHGDRWQRHTEAHTHVVGGGKIYGVFIVTPHWHDDGGPAGVVADEARELMRARHCIDAARRARVTHVVLSSACAGGHSNTVGPRSHEYEKERVCVHKSRSDMPHRPRPPAHIRSKEPIEMYLEHALGSYPYAKPGIRQVGASATVAH
jgi:hypothetical protein